MDRTSLPDFDSIDVCPACNYARKHRGHYCPTCSGWHRATDDFSVQYKTIVGNLLVSQYMLRSCPNCGYQWREKPANLSVSLKEE